MRLNTCTELALTKLDVLSPFKELKVCVAYEDESGTRYDHVPYHQSVLHKVRPITRRCPVGGDIEPGQRSRTCRLRRAEYVQIIEEFAGVHVSFVSVGPRATRRS